MKEFRALGGVAENIALGRGLFGRGLFPENPAKPFLLRLPANLLFPVADIEFVHGQIRIRDNAGVGAAERLFFERYHHSFSWGGGGRQESAELIAMFDSLPPEIRTLLSTDFGMQELLEGDPDKRAQSRFLHSRMIRWNDTEVLMPLIELANYGTEGRGYAVSPEGDLQIEGQAEGEILVNYGPQDPFDIFCTFGFVTARPFAYSRPMTTRVGSAKLAIDRSMAGTWRAGIWTPEMRVEGETIFLSHLMIGNTNRPRQSRGIFYALMREAGASGAEEAFDLILYANRGKFLKLLETTEPHRGELIAMVRRMTHFQLRAMAHCVGTREL